MVDLTRHLNKDGNLVVRARLLDLVPGRSGEAYKSWLVERGEAFRAGIGIATLDPFHGYKNAVDDQLEDARSVLDAFHQWCQHRRPAPGSTLTTGVDVDFEGRVA
jgi:transposase